MAGACLNSELQNLSWVALQVRPRSEKFVTSALTFKGIDTFLPLYTTRRRWSDRVKELELPLFEGYVFCKLDLQYRMPALLVPNVIQFVGFGKTPVAIEE